MARGKLGDGLGRVAAWIATAPAKRRWIGSRKDCRLLEIRAEDSVRLSAWLVDVDDARGTVVIGHGYRDDRRQLIDLAAPLAARGLRTLAFDFRAHGGSEGNKITIGVDEARDVRSVLAHAQSLGGPVSYVGFSMGAAAYLLAGREAHAAVLDSPYDTLRSAVDVRLTRMHIPSAIGDAILRHGTTRVFDEGGRAPGRTLEEIRPIDALPTLARPTLFIFASGDAWISEETRARFRAALSPTSVMEEVAGSHDAHFAVAWYARVARFLASAYQ